MSQADRQLLHDALRRFRAGAARLDGAAIRAALQSLTAELVPHRSAEMMNSVGLLAAELLQHDLASTAFRQALAVAPDRIDYQLNLASSLRFDRRLSEAITIYQTALASAPDNCKLLDNLTAALDEAGEFDRALENARRRAGLMKDDFTWHLDAGSVRLHQQQLAPAAEHFRAAIRLRPEHPMAHYKLGWALLLEGQFEQGWHEYEWRTTTAEQQARSRRLGTPVWDGDPLAERTLLLVGEGGLGDVLQFVRYAPELARRGARVVVEAPATLHRLLGSVASLALVTTADGPIPEHDTHLPIMSVPRLLGTRSETIPSEVPYLSVDHATVAAWAARLGTGERRPDLKRIGLVWSGNRLNANDRRRSCPPELFDQLAKVDGVQFYNLHQPDAFGFRPLPAVKMIDCVPWIEDMADTAAAIQQLDLVITVDTAVAHLAGALGRPVWILLPHSPDWRWQLQLEHSRWYPSAKLVRQPTPGDWTSLLKSVRAELQRFVDPSRFLVPSQSGRDR